MAERALHGRGSQGKAQLPSGTPQEDGKQLKSIQCLRVFCYFLCNIFYYSSRLREPKLRRQDSIWVVNVQNGKWIHGHRQFLLPRKQPLVLAVCANAAAHSVPTSVCSSAALGVAGIWVLMPNQCLVFIPTSQQVLLRNIPGHVEPLNDGPC